MDRLFMAIATGFGVGYLPKAPGTWGSLLALPIHYLIVTFAAKPLHYCAALLLIFFAAVLSTGAAEKIIDKRDPGIVVADEIIGMLIALIGTPPKVWAWIVAFLLFRIFDILKPFPVRFFDKRFHGGLGIVLDDVAAGLMTLTVMQIIYLF